MTNLKRYSYRALTTIGGEIYERMTATNQEDTRNEFYFWNDLYCGIQRELDRRTLNGEPGEAMNEDIRRMFEDKHIHQYQVAECLGEHESTFSRSLRKPLSPERRQAIIKAVEDLSEAR